MVLIIPLRSGSKRLKDKNIQKIIYRDDYGFKEENYIFYLVHKIAVCSRLFDKIIFAVDKEYEKIVRETLPLADIYVRSKKNSRDKSPLIDLVREVVYVYDIKDKYMCIAYATSILITEKHLIDAYKKITENDYDCVFPVVSQKIEYGSANVEMYSYVFNANIELAEGFKNADAFFMFNLQRALDNNTIISNNNDGFITVGELEYQDVHTAEDIELLKKKYKLR